MLHAVTTGPAMDAALPAGLIADGPGHRLWTSVTAAYVLRPDDLVLLEDAARLSDEIAARDVRIAQLDEAVGQCFTVAGSQGYNRRPNPLLGEVRAERIEQRRDRLARADLLARLHLTDIDPPADPGQTGGMSGGTAASA